MSEYPQPQTRTATLRIIMKDAVDLYRADRFDDCKNLCLQILKQRPDQPHALHLLGVVEMNQGNHAAAAPYFERALAQLDTNAEFHSNYGSLLSRMQRPAEAIECFRRAIVLKPDFADAHGNLGSVLLDQSRFDEALEKFLDAARLNPRLDGPHVGAGCAHKQLLHFPESVAAFRRAILAVEHRSLWRLEVRGKTRRACRGCQQC